MTFHEELLHRTEAERAGLQAAPIVLDALSGRVVRSQYIDFLTRAFHHVKFTVPLLMACGARLPDELEWLRAAMVEYASEELGHHEWILTDISAAGGDAAAVRRGQPDLDTEVLVAWAHDLVWRRNPVGFLGMVHVLEGTSVALATSAAAALRHALDLPQKAFTYLASHGALDVGHVGHFAKLVDRLDRQDDRETVVRSARVAYRLYGDVLRGIGRESAS